MQCALCILQATQTRCDVTDKVAVGAGYHLSTFCSQVKAIGNLGRFGGCNDATLHVIMPTLRASVCVAQRVASYCSEPFC